jgi:IgA Peptidase M64
VRTLNSIRNSPWWRALPLAILAAIVTSAGLLPPVGCGGPAPDGNGAYDDPDGNAGTGGEAGEGGEAGSGGSGSTAIVRPYTVELFVEIDKVSLFGIEPHDDDVAGAPPVRYGEPALMWWIEDASGTPVDGGIVADPRVAHADPGPDGDPSIEARVPSALLRLDTQYDKGTLIVVQQAPTGTSFRGGGCDPQANEVGRVNLSDEGIGGGGSSSGSAGTTTPGLRKIIDHGDCAYNLNLLIVSEGFTGGQLVKFREYALSFANQLRSFGGFKEHWDQVNVWTLEVPSQDSGISDPDNGVTKRTAFGVSFGQGANRRCVFPRNATADATNLRRKAEREAKINATTILAYSQEHGGCASGPLSVSTLGPHAPWVVAHELGHSLVNLADEYTEQWRCDIGRAGNRRNTTKNSTNPPWSSVVGTTFEGAEYCETGVFRAQQNCLMRNVGKGMNFCAVCTDAANRWFENRKLTHPDNACSQPAPPANDCFGGTPCPSGTVCAWNGPDIRYCCRAPFEGTKVCFTDEGCSNGQVCSFGGPPNNFFYCTTPDPNACED